LFLPKIAGAGHRRIDWHALTLLAEPRFAVTIACVFVAQAAMAAHYFYFSKFMMSNFDVARSHLTFFWAFGSVFEVVMLTQAGRLIRRFGTKRVLTVGMAGIALRLGIYATVPAWPVVFVVQGLHAFTFGAVHSSTVTFVNYAAPTKWRASAQTLFEGITIGLGMAVGALVGGQIAQRWDYRTLFACASAAAALACVVYALFGRPASLVREPEESPGEGLAEQ
ncbi:MAG TPA: MFS transporter, partial [Planctomycetota bacterium]|nr:MFS transporter [Planctomycetota bacterium]